jgi:FixJ family two-component response regulator
MEKNKPIIYIIHDRSENRDPLIMLLESFGFATCSFTTSEQLIDSWMDKVRPLCLLFYVQHFESELHYLTRLRATNNNWPVIVIIDMLNLQLMARARQLNIIEILIKPINPVLLRAKLYHLIASTGSSDACKI